MIKELFLPEKIGNTRVLAQRIASIALHEAYVRIALVHATGSKRVIEKLLEERIEEGSIETYIDRAGAAIKKLLAQIKQYDQIRVAIPASLVVFKELGLQFSDPEKIRMILDYEIESMLPFSINDSVADFIITSVNAETKTSQILVAAVRSQDLQEQLEIYKKAGVDPAAITIDLFAYYGLYQQIPEYHQLSQATAIVEIGTHATRIVFILNGQLRLTRSIPRGISTVTKLIADEMKVPTENIYKMLTDQGPKSISDDPVMRAVQKHFVLLLNDIQFTLNSFSLKLNFYEGVSKILLIAPTHQIKDLVSFCSDTLQITCEEFDGKKLLDNKAILDKTKEPIERFNNFLLALGIALPSLGQSDFDLRRKQFTFQRQGLVFKQLIVAGSLTMVMLLAICIKGYFDISELTGQARKIEKAEINRFKVENVFPKGKFPAKPNLKIVIREGEKIVEEKRGIWAAFQQQRMRPLEVLAELTNIINKKKFDITIKEIILSTKDAGALNVEVEGFFKSKTGDHFTDFIVIENRFKESVLLKPIDAIEATPADGGVNFTAKLRLREV